MWVDSVGAARTTHFLVAAAVSVSTGNGAVITESCTVIVYDFVPRISISSATKATMVSLGVVWRRVSPAAKAALLVRRVALAKGAAEVSAQFTPGGTTLPGYIVELVFFLASLVQQTRRRGDARK